MKTTVVLRTDTDKDRLREIVWRLSLDTPKVVTIGDQKETRSTLQNRRMWAMLGDVSKQVVWHGMKLTPENWKDMATAALKRQQVVPGIEGGFVVLGTSTSRMKVAEMAELIEFLYAFGAEHGVVWSDPTLPTEEP